MPRPPALRRRAVTSNPTGPGRGRRAPLGHACPGAAARGPPNSPPNSIPGVASVLLLSPRRGPAAATKGERETMDDDGEHEHPKGALLFMLIYLLTLTALWLNAYARLWQR